MVQGRESSRRRGQICPRIQSVSIGRQGVSAGKLLGYDRILPFPVTTFALMAEKAAVWKLAFQRESVQSFTAGVILLFIATKYLQFWKVTFTC